ncbi:unnamed protein product [Orchesella dallaii]|uniref:Odorant receptor n=1 Tax=Orchesella dallaii TaxID=48710 RepID=A0ABP1S0D7_9HEXA
MLLSKSSQLLKYLQENIKICDFFGGIQYKWNKERNKLEVKSNLKRKLYGVRFYLALMYKFFVMFQVISTWKQAKMVVITHNVMFIGSYVVIAINGYIFHRQADLVATLFNSLINFEQRHYKGKFTTNVKGSFLIIFMVRMMTATGILMPTLYHLDIIRNPCFPVYLGYWLSDQCEDGKLGHALPATWSGIEFGTKIGIALCSYLNWNLLMTGIPFFVNVAYTLHAHCYRSYIYQYGQTIRKIMSTSSDSRHKEARIQTKAFRELQIIGILHREIYCSYVLPVSLICCILMQVVCLYNTITVLLKENGKQTDEDLQIGLNLVYLWCTFLSAIAILVLFGIMAGVYKVGRQVHSELDSFFELKRSKWFRQFLKSCPILRVYIGGSNFIDGLTPLTAENFAIDQTVSLLLLQ